MFCETHKTTELRGGGNVSEPKKELEIYCPFERSEREAYLNMIKPLEITFATPM